MGKDIKDCPHGDNPQLNAILLLLAGQDRQDSYDKAIHEFTGIVEGFAVLLKPYTNRLSPKDMVELAEQAAVAAVGRLHIESREKLKVKKQVNPAFLKNAFPRR